ncbi:MAG: UpxY family transcription antiterminator [Prevotella sp.]|nr:UpxY family transcription antiterminator [Prevotella sp.]
MLPEKDAELWYALQTYYAQEMKVGDYLKSHHLTFFIPMSHTFTPDAEGNPVRHSSPIVHNIIFLKKTLLKDVIKDILSKCPYAIRVYTYPCETAWEEIPEEEIKELRLLCDCEFADLHIIHLKKSDLKVGHMVKVVHGPLKGIHGLLIRKSKKFYIVKSYVGMEIAVIVSRWCCEKLDE